MSIAAMVAWASATKIVFKRPLLAEAVTSEIDNPMLDNGSGDTGVPSAAYIFE
jgi:hypothetical protein